MKKWQKWTAGIVATIITVALVIAVVETISANRATKEAEAKVATLEAKAAAPATPIETPAERAYKSNVESWTSHKSLKTEAQIALAPNWERVVHQMVDKSFTSHDQRVVCAAGRNIFDLAGDRATAIILEYVNDPRVVVAENARDWYKKYHPGAILDKIEAKPTPPPAPTRPRIDLRALKELERRVDSLEAAHEKARKNVRTVGQVEDPSYDCLKMEIQLLEREHEILRELNAAKAALKTAQES